jgi:hypothetical protein
MASEDFMPSSSNPLQVDYVLPAGSYVFEIANPDAATLGAYTFKTVMNPTLACDPLIFTTLGVTINGDLTNTDCQGPGAGDREDRYIILPPVGVRADLTVTSTAIAPFLVFRDDRLGPASPWLVSDSHNVVGQTAHVSYTNTFSGFHEIVVANATSALGAYTLTIGTTSAANTCVLNPSFIGGKITALWETTDCKNADNSLYDRYSFALTSQTAVHLNEVSTAGPKILGVFTAAGTEVLEWLGGTGDFDATWYLAPGQYEIRATQPASAAGTQYTLNTSVANGNITCETNSTTGNVSFTNQTLASGDCAFQGRFEDRLVMLVQAGQDISVTMTASAFAPAAIIRDPASPAGTFLVRSAGSSLGNETATWHVTTTGYYQVIFSSVATAATGSYSGSITVH